MNKFSIPSIFFILAGAALLLIIGIFFWTQSPSAPTADFSLQNCMDLNRESYGISPGVFAELPSPPKCFQSTINARRIGTFTDDFFFTEAFYSQPEFYSSFSSNGLPYWHKPVSRNWGIVGFGIQFNQKQLSIRAGETKKVRIFMHSGYGIRTFQGVRIVPVVLGRSIAPFISIKGNPDASEAFVLGPNFPKFDPRWSKALEFEISVSPSAESNYTIIEFRTASPYPEQNQQFETEFSGKYYPVTHLIGEKKIAELRLTIES